MTQATAPAQPTPPSATKDGHGDHPETHAEVDRRWFPQISSGKLAMWLFLATEIMFFTGLIGSYIVLRFGSPTWPNPQTLEIKQKNDTVVRGQYVGQDGKGDMEELEKEPPVDPIVVAAIGSNGETVNVSVRRADIAVRTHADATLLSGEEVSGEVASADLSGNVSFPAGETAASSKLAITPMVGKATELGRFQIANSETVDVALTNDGITDALIQNGLSPEDAKRRIGNIDKKLVNFVEDKLKLADADKPKFEALFTKLNGGDVSADWLTGPIPVSVVKDLGGQVAESDLAKFTVTKDQYKECGDLAREAADTRNYRIVTGTLNDETADPVLELKTADKTLKIKRTNIQKRGTYLADFHLGAEIPGVGSEVIGEVPVADVKAAVNTPTADIHVMVDYDVTKGVRTIKLARGSIASGYLPEWDRPAPEAPLDIQHHARIAYKHEEIVDHQDPLAIGVTAANTFFLIVSSVTMVVSMYFLKKGARSKGMLFLFLTILIGAVFVGIQFYEYHKLIVDEHFVPRSNLFASCFYIMTGCHGAHVSGGVIMLLTIFIAMCTGKYKTSESAGNIVELSGLYWHFVDLVWILLFTVVYLI